MSLRLLVFFVGLGCVAFGVAVTTKALLGTTPIAALPYSVSLIFPSVSFGACVIGFNLALIAAEWALLRGRIRFWAIFLQAFLACIFGTCVDGSMFVLLGWDPNTYLERLLWVAGARCSSAWAPSSPFGPISRCSPMTPSCSPWPRCRPKTLGACA